ncbi:MAG: M48 family metalloprotease [Acidobacteria bacterium]|nr:M48 family metalloprotease [Acidobacteriota bacterium]
MAMNSQGINPVSCSFRKPLLCLAAALALLLLTANPLAARVEIKPGFNTFTPQQDIQFGQEAVKEVEKEFQLVADSQLNEYLNRLGQNLAKYAPGHRYPYSFKLVDAKEINAFALPGGPIYVHRGLLVAASSEAQLAGVLAHEISHVALRHSTNQASKAMLAQAPLAILGGILSGGGLGGQLAQLGIAFGLNSAFMKFSRDAERQADEMGAQILYDAGYDPKAMAELFAVIEKESGGGGVEFLSSHPNPGNRQKDVTQLIPQLGPAKTYTADNTEFAQIKRRLEQWQQPQSSRQQRAAARSQPAEPSRQLRSLNTDWFHIAYPENWEVFGQGSSTFTLVPPEGVITGEDNLPAIAYGALVSFYEPSGRRPSLEAATDQLIRQLQQSNPPLRVSRRSRLRRAFNGQDGLSVLTTGQSPISGQREMNWIVTTFRPEGLWYVVFIAPEGSWNIYEPVFDQMLDSVRFPR